MVIPAQSTDNVSQFNIFVVWRPIPGTSQCIALDSRAHHTLYCGTRGPGKTDVQLMRFRRRVGIGYGSYWRGVIFDREYKHLDDLISKSKRWFSRFNDGAKFLEGTASLKWVWPTGEELLFRQIKKDEDYENYHGHEFPFIGWNELTKYPTPKLYDMMMSCNRSSWTWEKDAPINSRTGERLYLPPIPLEVFSTTNPYGAGHHWVKRRFIDVAPYGQLVKRAFTVFNPQTQKEEEVIRTQVAIFGSYKENIYLDPIYIAGLSEDQDENRRKAWLDGNWDVVAGGAFDDLWDSNIHVIDQFPIPAHWYVDRSLDWGSSHPFSIGWWAESPGEEVVTSEGNKYFFARGSLIRIAEWYGTKEIGTNRGIKLGATDVGRGTRAREIEMIASGWLGAQPSRGPADNEIRNVREKDTETIEKKMQDEGIYWQDSDKSAGSRRVGMELFRQRLINAVRREGPGIFFMRNCEAAIQTIPYLPRDEDYPDDVDTEAEDHPYDETRYRVLKSANRIAKKVKVSYPRS